MAPFPDGLFSPLQGVDNFARSSLFLGLVPLGAIHCSQVLALVSSEDEPGLALCGGFDRVLAFHSVTHSPLAVNSFSLVLFYLSIIFSVFFCSEKAM